MWHDMAIIILCSWSPSPKHRHDLHRHRRDTLISIVASLLSRQLLLLRLLLPLCDKVKQLHGDCIAYNKVTTICLLLVANIFFYKTWSSHTTIYITSCLDHITSQQALQKQVRHGCYGLLARTVLTYASNPQWFFDKCVVLTFNKDRA